MTDPPRDQKRAMLAGELYLAGDPELVAERQRCAELLHRYNTAPPGSSDEARSVLQELLGSIGAESVIRAPVWFDYGSNTHVGDRTFVNFGAVILDVVEVCIGSDVQIASSVQLLTATHPLDAEARIAGWESGAPIEVGDGAWLGGGVIVCPGVSIGARTVVGAGAVVTKDLPPGVLAVGNPARVVREL